MPIPSPEESVNNESFRDRCYGCFRPRSACFCAAIPHVDNRTKIVLVQHFRERFHPFNTARIVHRALQNSQLLVDHIPNLAKLTFPPCAGLLYPGPGAKLLSDLAPAERPQALVVLDGTWHHTKTLMREIPTLRQLPRFQLAPESPSRYRIRREPSDQFISTIEATVAALRLLEPNLVGLTELLVAFDVMVEGQLAHPKSDHGLRRYRRRRRTNSHNVPLVLTDDLNNVVVAYGESTPRPRHRDRGHRNPIVWVAERMGTGQRFYCTIRPESEADTSPGGNSQTSFSPELPPCLPSPVLEHLGLVEADFLNALSLAEASAAWAEFCQPMDKLAVYNQGTARLLQRLTPQTAAPEHGVASVLVLKSIDFHPTRHYGTLDDLLSQEGLISHAPHFRGRAGKRLANVATFVRYLHQLGTVGSSR